jgi:hypothetical protein
MVKYQRAYKKGIFGQGGQSLRDAEQCGGSDGARASNKIDCELILCKWVSEVDGWKNWSLRQTNFSPPQGGGGAKNNSRCLAFFSLIRALRNFPAVSHLFEVCLCATTFLHDRCASPEG